MKFPQKREFSWFVFFDHMRAPLLILHVIVLWVLVVRGWRWMGAIPFLGIVVLGIWYYQRQQYTWSDVRLSLHEMLESYGLMGAWLIFLIGIWQLFHIFGIVTYTTWFRLLWWHLLVYLGAIVLQKKDLALVAHAWWRASGWLLIIQSLQFNDRWLVMDMVSMMIALSFAMYACIVFSLGTLGHKIDRRVPAFLFIFSQLTVLVGVIHYAETFTLWTLLWGQIYLGIFYGLLQWLFYENKIPMLMPEQQSEDVLHRILRGGQVVWTQIPVSTMWWSLRALILHIGNEIVRKLPAWSFRVLASVNLLLMLSQLFLILSWKTGDVGIWIDVWFRISVAVFVMNYFVLQQQRIEVWWQRAMTFLLINFGIYLTIYHLFGNVPVYLVGCGVVRSLCNAGIMIYLRTSSLNSLLTEKDYQYWLFGNMIAIIANSYFMFLLPMSLQLRFTLVMIYLALQALFLKYQLTPSVWSSKRT